MNMNIKIGLCYRNWLHEKYLNQILDIVDIIEIMPDITDVEEIKLIKKSCEEKNIYLSIHSLRSNIGSVEGIHKDETDKYFFVNYYCDSVYFSDHMAFSHILGNYLSSVNQLIYNEENIRVVQKNIAQLEHKFSDTPVLIENITQNNLRKDSTMRESDFWHSVFQNLGSNVGIMLDITNMYVTSKNNNIDFFSYIKGFPLHKVECIHLSGYEIMENNRLQDSHLSDIDENIFAILREILPQTNAKYVLLERDFNVFNFNDISNEIAKIKEAVNTSVLL